MVGGMYTWCNKHLEPTLEKLDRVLMSPSWEDLFPLVHVNKFVRELSDHNPLILDCGLSQLVDKKPREFRIDISWFKHEDFLPTVERIWGQNVSSSDPIDVLNIKLKRFKKYFKGWGSNLFGHNKKHKCELQEELLVLEILKELTPLHVETYNHRVEILAELYELYADEELHWLQFSNERWLLQGDNNTAYYHKVANGKK